ncbi:Fpg/Nei family DNA glycosylase [Georgenia satyanarayanai]|uniref:Fpg/Nei family DNA glycosylase n=1 Tax=Georgenia satyanarayanai TaxID=860221 RepID=UPI00203D5103|nr:DNA-formamidopyrimidine glycosylase family protein [Georgenia satyanarayanai]MCM3661681.1 Fpg/Nei family DNA glycosylase [Georgenia satyanarayanai]
MPEGHSIHRLALAFDELLHGERLEVTSPQGRFAAGAELLDGRRLAATDAHGKHLFLGFSQDGEAPEDFRWLRVHLGLYGSWTFAGDTTFQAPHAIGAPRRRVAEEETPVDDGGAQAPAPAEWEPPEPRGAVRVRLLGEHGVADLTGPTACEVVTPQEKDAVHARLGPDPLRADGDVEQFVANVRRRARPVGELLMDQSVIAGVGNIYRAEALYRARLHPRKLGRTVAAPRLREMWADLVTLMSDGVATGRIVTTEPEDRQEDEDRWYVYHREGRPCLRCGSRVAEDEMAGRRVFWCPREQRRPSAAA